MSHLKKLGLMMIFLGFHHAWLHAATFPLDPSHTSIGFSVKHLMITDVSGQFKTYEAKVELGERGPVWWSDGAPDYNRHLIKNTPYGAAATATGAATGDSRS